MLMKYWLPLEYTTGNTTGKTCEMLNTWLSLDFHWWCAQLELHWNILGNTARLG
jgi:hypothetical protein